MIQVRPIYGTTRLVFFIGSDALLRHRPWQEMKVKLQDELRKTSDLALTTGSTEAEIARKKAESRLFGLSTALSAAQSDRIRQEMARYATMRDPRLRL